MRRSSNVLAIWDGWFGRPHEAPFDFVEAVRIAQRLGYQPLPMPTSRRRRIPGRPPSHGASGQRPVLREKGADDRGGDIGPPEGRQVTEPRDHDRGPPREGGGGELGGALSVLVFSADDQRRSLYVREIGELVVRIRPTVGTDAATGPRNCRRIARTSTSPTSSPCSTTQRWIVSRWSATRTAPGWPMHWRPATRSASARWLASAVWTILATALNHAVSAQLSCVSWGASELSAADLVLDDRRQRS